MKQMRLLSQNPFSVTSAAIAFGLLPAWIWFWWLQRHGATTDLILIGGPLLVVLAAALGAIAWRRREPCGPTATAASVLLPALVFVWMNFVGNP